MPVGRFNHCCQLAIAVATFSSAPAHAATTGALADFEGSFHGFGGGSNSYTNPATGGVGDSGHLVVANDVAPGNLAARTADPHLTGDYPGAGVTGVRFWLKDVGVDDALEIHVGVGLVPGNMWQSNAGFDPPTGSWQQYAVDLEDASQWTQIIGPGSFEEAVSSGDRLQFRHDFAPYEQLPDVSSGDFGIDEVQLIGPPRLPVADARALWALLVGLATSGALILHRLFEPAAPGGSSAGALPTAQRPRLPAPKVPARGSRRAHHGQ